MIDDIIEKDLKSACNNIGYRFADRHFLVTGGAGFLGSWLIDLLLMLDAKITCMDNLSSGQTENIDHLLGNSKFHFAEDDVAKFNHKDIYDYIIHLASRASPKDYRKHPIETLITNSLGSERMLEIARKFDIPILYASTSEVYGDAQLIPTSEDYWGNVNPVGERSCYDEGKRFGEALFMAYKREYNLDIRIARIFNSYGPRIRSVGEYARAIPKFIEQALKDEPLTVYGNGVQTRSFCYVADTIVGLILLLMNNHTEGNPINIGTSHEIRILNLAHKIIILAGSKSKIVFQSLPPDDPKRRCPELSKAKKILGWKPRFTLDEGLNKTIQWFKNYKVS